MISRYIVDIARILEGALSGDKPRVCVYADHLAKKLEAAGEAKSARRLRAVVENDQTSLMSLALAPMPRAEGPAVPNDLDSGMPIADEQVVAPGSVRVSLPIETKATVDRFVSFFRASGKLRDHGVGFTPSMLFFGPPGCGKTQLARFLAAELGLPLIVARVDGLISSYLGSTSKNLRKLFDYAATHPCILFLDEFDALAKMRDDDKELGELKRVVISLLQNIDSIGPNHVLLAATNHEHLLDPAIWRRFTYKIHIELPGRDVRSELLSQFLGSFAEDGAIDLLSSVSDGLSGAQIRDFSIDAVRSAIVHDRTAIDTLVLMRELLGAVSKDSEAGSVNMKSAIQFLRDKSFTQQRIADICGVSQPRVSQILRELRDGERA